MRLCAHANLIAGEGTPAIHAVLSLKALMEDCADQEETIMQWLSKSPTAGETDREIGTTGAPLGGTPLCSYLRYNVLLTSEWFEKNLGDKPSRKALEALCAMDEPDNIPELNRAGRLAGQRLVQAAHFPVAFDLG